MLFHSLQFAVFFALVYALYRILPHRAQNRLLLLASYFFYGSWNWRYLALILLSTAVDYGCGRGIAAAGAPRRRSGLLAISIATNLAILGTFKYYDFFAESFADLVGNFGFASEPYFLNLALPVGISFYTFQSMSYSIDVYRRKLAPARNFWDFALFVAFFPQLIAGPIERGTRLLRQIVEPRNIERENVLKGAYLFGWGFVLKVVFADNLALVVDPIFAAPPPYGSLDVLLGVYAFSLQIFCDFAGYSCMAIGIARSMGIELMENFRRPYLAPNIAEFWRRWHISLSSWFRDYVFSPLFLALKNRRGVRSLPLAWRHGVSFAITLIVAEFLLGMWHGAGWNYGLFGLYHAGAIWGYYYTRRGWDRMPRSIQIVLNFHLVCGGWLLFRSESLPQAAAMFAGLLSAPLPSPPSVAALSILLCCGIAIFSVERMQEKQQQGLWLFRWPSPVRYALVVFASCLVLAFGEFGNRPFIYFQF